MHAQVNTWINVTGSPYGVASPSPTTVGIAYCQQFPEGAPLSSGGTQYLAQVMVPAAWVQRATHAMQLALWTVHEYLSKL
jgi:hypothetical protein